jgi:hypothetical protein
MGWLGNAVPTSYDNGSSYTVAAQFDSKSGQSGKRRLQLVPIMFK